MSEQDPAQHATAPQHPGDEEEVLRPHIYDGIQEYDKRLPNWWLWTLYGAVIFAIGYWAILHNLKLGKDPGIALKAQMEQNTLLAARSSGAVNDDQLWQMSRDSSVVASGRTTFLSTCASCHKPDLTGAIGPSLVDAVWIHGGAPGEIVGTISQGVAAKGMPAWGPVLGKTKINEVAAFILSYQKERIAPLSKETTTAQN